MLSNFNILVVDDNTDNYDFLSIALHQRGATVYRAETPEQALEAVHSLQPNCILMDLLLRSKTFGWDAIAALKADLSTRHIPVIAMTAGGPNALQKAMEAGADAYIERPFSIQAIVGLITQLVSA